MYHCFFRRHVCLSNLKHALSRELPLTACKTVFSYYKFQGQRAGDEDEEEMKMKKREMKKSRSTCSLSVTINSFSVFFLFGLT